MTFFVEFWFFSLFFFSKKFLPNSVFFFPRKSLPVTHSLDFQGRKKKKTAPEKKTAFSLTHSFFHQKVQILNFSGEKKNTVPLLRQILFWVSMNPNLVSISKLQNCKILTMSQTDTFFGTHES